MRTSTVGPVLVPDYEKNDLSKVTQHSSSDGMSAALPCKVLDEEIHTVAGVEVTE